MVKIIPRVAVIGGTGYLASLLKNQKNLKKFKYIFFSRKKNSKNYINTSILNKKKNILKNFNYIIHLAGPNQDELKKNKNLIKKKIGFTEAVCKICLNCNIKLIYISSLQVYKDYGKYDINLKSKINFKNVYSKSHYETEKLILAHFLNNKKMFTVLRMGNVFGFKKYEHLSHINDNLIHNLCNIALKKKKIIIHNGSIQRNFVPSKMFIQIVNYIIEKNLFNNSIINISYKYFSLKKIAQIIENRLWFIFKSKIEIKIKKFRYKKTLKTHLHSKFKFNANIQKIYFEIDQILKLMSKNN